MSLEHLDFLFPRATHVFRCRAALVIVPTRPYKAARLSQTVKDACGDDDDNGSPEDVDIIKVDSSCLQKVVEFLKHYDEEPLTEIKTPLEENTFDGVVKQTWYQDFVKGVDQPMLFDLVTAANFMAIREWNIVL
jgi:S-phase kinase-associated protein 1